MIKALMTVHLTRSECEAINQFFSYGATRGNHSELDGSVPGPLTAHIDAMAQANNKISAALREADQA